MQVANTWKLDTGTMLARDWGGINMVFLGDFNQLQPVQTTSMLTLPTSIYPRSFAGNPQVCHGRNLLWHSMNQFIKLTEQQRCVDVFWWQVQTELRHGKLCNVNHQFLHGLPTTHCGHWLTVDQKSVCVNGCVHMESECHLCEAERERRARVFNSGVFMDVVFTVYPINNLYPHSQWRPLVVD